jgi:hypothetical protein
MENKCGRYNSNFSMKRMAIYERFSNAFFVVLHMPFSGGVYLLQTNPLLQRQLHQHVKGDRSYNFLLSL